MDSWSNEQVEVGLVQVQQIVHCRASSSYLKQNMKKVGNLTSNKLYNPQNKKPPVPIDADEADSAMERFIRTKYTNHNHVGSKRHNTGSTESDETPPPLPPKTPSRFGFRSASSIFPLSSKAKKDAARGARDQFERSPVSPQQRNKPSRVFGAGVGFEDESDTERKLARLRDMGFTDDQRNAIVLKGVNGNLERTVEALVRLGEGNGRSALPTPTSEAPPSSRSLTPSAPSGGAGLSISRPERPLSPASNNPFDMSPVQPISSQSTGNIQNRNPYFNNNPFGMSSSQSNDALNQAFQNMALAPSQPLFPHHTGGAPNQQPQQVVYQQAMTPPIPSIPQNYAAMSFNNNQTYPQPTQHLQPQTTGYNPFFTNSQPQTLQQPPPQTLSVNTAFGNYAGNPFTRSPTRIVSPSLGQIPEQTQQNFYSSPVQQSPVNNPFFNQMSGAAPSPAPVAPPQAQVQPQYQQGAYYGQQIAQMPQRPDKASIMALYNYPQLAPQQAYQTPTQEQPQQVPASLNQMVQPQPTPASPPQAPASPIFSPGSKNPFLSNNSSPAPPQAVQQLAAMDSMVGNRSRDSMMASGLEWSNGRHSPDAFASLSARDMR